VTPRLIVVSDFSHRDEAESLERMTLVCELARPGAVMLQLRDHELSARRRLELGRELCSRAHAAGQLMVVNDRIDLALVLGADGAHLGERSVTVADARRLLGDDAFVSRAAHGLDAVGSRGESAVVLSPIVEDRHGRAALGIGALSGARALVRGATLFALGGVSAENARALRAAGADGVAVMGALLDVADPGPLVAALEIGR
jgi:thiamine-phosphate pyrophosphorylase